MLEAQTILVELLAKFEFSLPKNYKGVTKTPVTNMAPTIPGDREAGSRLDLEVSILPH